jgi:hypothetical protein
MPYLLILRTRRHVNAPIDPVAKVVGYCDTLTQAEQYVADTYKMNSQQRDYPSIPAFVEIAKCPKSPTELSSLKTGAKPPRSINPPAG